MAQHHANRREHRKHLKKVQSKQIRGHQNKPNAVKVRVRLSKMLYPLLIKYLY
jgi:hypothetical protein